MKKILIIGAGISGLYLANLLEKNGNYDYKILEKNNETFFKYSPKKKFKHKNKENMKENPFYTFHE